MYNYQKNFVSNFKLRYKLGIQVQMNTEIRPRKVKADEI